MDKEFRRSIATTTLILIAIVMLIATFSMGVFLTQRSARALRTLTQDYMLSVSGAAAGMVNGDELDRLSYGSEDSEEYKHVRSTLEAFNANIELEDIYCLKHANGHGYIFVMDLTTDNPAQYGDPVTSPTDALRRAAQGEDAADDEPYEDAWGRFYSAYSPVFDSAGKVAGIIAVDFDATWYDEQLSAISRDVFYMGSISLIIGAAVVAIMTARSRRNLKRAHAQLNELSDNIEELIVGIGDLSHADLNKEVQKKVKMVYEDDGLEALGEKITNMQEALKEQIAHIQENAYIDGMTRTKNKTAYLEDTAHLEKAIKNGSISFAVGVFDIAGLKTINDTQGHECGDNAIIDTADALTAVFGRDNLYRVGGDEFVAGLRYASEEEMKKSFEMLDSVLDEINSVGGQYETIPLVLSKGYAIFDPETDSEYLDTFNRADKRMYEDKAAYYTVHDRRRRDH